MAQGQTESRKLRLYSSSASKDRSFSVHDSPPKKKSKHGCIPLKSIQLSQNQPTRPTTTSVEKRKERKGRITRVARETKSYKKIAPIRVIDLIKCSPPKKAKE